jgi:hypothetical protein
MDPATLASASIWLLMIVLGGFAIYRVRTRRSHIGSPAAGTVYDIIQDEKRKAIEIVVADKAAARDFEHGEDNKDPDSNRHR